MRILVMSDSHGWSNLLFDIIDRHNEVRDVFFLGDGLRDIEDVKYAFGDKNFYTVAGNCDFVFAESEGLTELGGKRIFFTHGHMYSVKAQQGFDSLRARADDLKAHIALFGHTHNPFYGFHNGLYLLNPGAVRDGKYALIDINDGKVFPALNEINR